MTPDQRCARHRIPGCADSPERDAGMKAGNLNIGVQTSHSERVSLIMSAVLIAGGIARLREEGTGEV